MTLILEGGVNRQRPPARRGAMIPGAARQVLTHIARTVILSPCNLRISIQNLFKAQRFTILLTPNFSLVSQPHCVRLVRWDGPPRRARAKLSKRMNADTGRKYQRATSNEQRVPARRELMNNDQ